MIAQYPLALFFRLGNFNSASLRHHVERSTHIYVQIT